MLDVFKKMIDYDILFFTPQEEEDEIRIEMAHYKDRGEPTDLGAAGHNSYDVVLFRFDDDDGVSNLEKFQAVLIEPREYVTRMIQDDWYGFVAKRTTTSSRVVQEMFDNWCEAMLE
jgi:hypothetical protein